MNERELYFPTIEEAALHLAQLWQDYDLNTVMEDEFEHGTQLTVDRALAQEAARDIISAYNRAMKGQ